MLLPLDEVTKEQHESGTPLCPNFLPGAVRKSRVGRAAARPGRLALWLSLFAAVGLLSGCSGKSVAKVSNEIDANEIMDVLKESGFDVDKEEVGESTLR